LTTAAGKRHYWREKKKSRGPVIGQLREKKRFTTPWETCRSERGKGALLFTRKRLGRKSTKIKELEILHRKRKKASTRQKKSPGGQQS